MEIIKFIYIHTFAHQLWIYKEYNYADTSVKVKTSRDSGCGKRGCSPTFYINKANLGFDPSAPVGQPYTMPSYIYYCILGYEFVRCLIIWLTIYCICIRPFEYYSRDPKLITAANFVYRTIWNAMVREFLQGRPYHGI